MPAGARDFAMRAVSHLTLATPDVARMLRLLQTLFGVRPAFENEQFGEVVLPSGFRIAFFRVTGATAAWFTEDADRRGVALGVTVEDVEATWQLVAARLGEDGLAASGPPKDHPWGERSFLLVDPDGNRWEVTQAADAGGMLPTR